MVHDKCEYNWLYAGFATKNCLKIDPHTQISTVVGKVISKAHGAYEKVPTTALQG